MDGISRMQAFENDIVNNKWEMFGFQCLENGKETEHWGDICGRYPVYSVVKSITSIAVGMAWDEGKLDLEKSVLHYLPREIICGMSSDQKEVYRLITLRRLMTMSVAGYPFRPSGESWLESSLAYPLVNPEHKMFSYSNISAYLAGVAAACAVNENLYDYLNRKLFVPLGIENPPCTFCPDGYFYGASGMELSVQELGKIGLLLMNHGVANSQRIISKEYVNEAVSIQQMNREGGYGYFIWKYRDGFSINGKWGQKCFVLPHKGQVITFLSHMESGSTEVIRSMEKLFLID